MRLSEFANLKFAKPNKSVINRNLHLIYFAKNQAINYRKVEGWGGF